MLRSRYSVIPDFQARLGGDEKGWPAITDLTIIALISAIFLGALSQRVSGLGFALLASPILVLLVGPREGVRQINLLALFVSISVLSTSFRHVDLSRAVILVPSGLIGVIPGVFAARLVPAGPLQIVIAVLVLFGLVTVIVSDRVRITDRRSESFAFGLTSGFMTATSGTGGPALTIYAIGTKWNPRAFVATIQLSFAAQQSLSLALKGLPNLTLPRLALYLLALFSGLWVGNIAASRVSEEWIKVAIISLAIAGSVTLLIKGVAVTL